MFVGNKKIYFILHSHKHFSRDGILNHCALHYNTDLWNMSHVSYFFQQYFNFVLGTNLKIQCLNYIYLQMI